MTSARKNNMPRFDFAPDDEFEERTVKLSQAQWSMLDKYCGFVEKKTGHRPSYGKVFDRLLDNLFGTDKAFRHHEGLVRAKKLSARQQETVAQPAVGPVAAPAGEAKASASLTTAMPVRAAALSSPTNTPSTSSTPRPERANMTATPPPPAARPTYQPQAARPADNTSLIPPSTRTRLHHEMTGDMFGNGIHEVTRKDFP